MYDRNYEELANAIIMQAVNDYRASWKKRNGAIERRQIQNFFNSRLFVNITDIAPGYLIRKLEDEHR